MRHPSRPVLLALFTVLSTACLAQGSLTAGAGGGGTIGGGSGPSGGSVPVRSEAEDAVADELPEPQLDDLSFSVKEYTQGSLHRVLVINQLTTFKVGAKCWSKMLDPQGDVVDMAAGYASSVREYAKKVTGDDWSTVEGQNKKLVKPMIEAFRSKFSLTIAVEGDDCETDHGALWMRYWSWISSTVLSLEPQSGKLFITLDVTPKVKAVTVTVDPKGTTFHITAPRDLEAKGWDDAIARPFRKRAKS